LFSNPSVLILSKHLPLTGEEFATTKTLSFLSSPDKGRWLDLSRRRGLKNKTMWEGVQKTKLCGMGLKNKSWGKHSKNTQNHFLKLNT
jgi:hypothetical protein